MRFGRNRYAMLTVDTEALPKRASRDHVKRLIWGEHPGGTAGVREMCAIGDDYSAKHIFFTDLCGAYESFDEMRDVVRWIDAAGHDVQLHAHPEYLPGSFWAKHGLSSKPQYMNQYDDDARAEFVISHFGREISSITGKPILAFRAGSFRWNASTIRALKAAGIPLSFDNSTAAFYNKQAAFSEQTNSPFLWSNGIIEVPITEKKILPKVGRQEWWARLQFPESSYFRFRPWWGGLLFNMLSGSPDFAVFLMHSWSLLYWDENEYGVYRDDKRLEEYRKLVKKIAKDYDVITSQEFLDLYARRKIETRLTVDVARAEIERKQTRQGQFRIREKMHPKLIDAIRDLAVKYEKTDVAGSLELMRLALKHKPHGPYIRAKVELYESILRDESVAHKGVSRQQRTPKTRTPPTDKIKSMQNSGK